VSLCCLVLGSFLLLSFVNDAKNRVSAQNSEGRKGLEFVNILERAL